MATRLSPRTSRKCSTVIAAFASKQKPRPRSRACSRRLLPDRVHQCESPVVKAPSLICDDGEVLMDSTLIIDYAEALAAGRRSLMPGAPHERQHTLREIEIGRAH